MDAGIHHVPRVHRVGGDAVRREAAVELIAEEDVAEFGPVVGQHGPVALPVRRQQGQVHFAAGVQQVCEPGQIDRQTCE